MGRISDARLQTIGRVVGDAVDESVDGKAYADGAYLEIGSAVQIGTHSNGYPILGKEGLDAGLPFIAHGIGHRYGFELLDDFLPFASADWEEDYDSGSSISQADGVGGLIDFATAAGSGAHRAQIRTDLEAFLLTASSGIIAFDCAVKLGDATDSALLAGLAVKTDDIIATHVAATLTDGVFLYKADGETDIRLVTLAGGSATESSVIATASTSWLWLGWTYNGSSVQAYVNGVASYSNSTNIPTAVEMAPHLALASDAAAKTMQADWIRARQLRTW